MKTKIIVRTQTTLGQHSPHGQPVPYQSYHLIKMPLSKQPLELEELPVIDTTTEE